MFKISSNVCPDDIFPTGEPNLTKVGMVINHNKLECHAKYV